MQSEFCFSLRCAECGEVWKSRAIRFSRAGVTPLSEGKRVIFDTLYKREKDEALLRAAGEAGKAFNRCPICHRMVCDHCFLVCDELDMCVACARHLQEHGEPVAECTEGGNRMKPIEFRLSIQNAENCSWQGTVKSSDSGLTFQSELELLFFIQKELEKRGAALVAKSSFAKKRKRRLN